MKFKSNGWRIAALVIAALLILTGIYFLLPYVLSLAGWAVRVFMPFILGYVFSLAINPLADKLQKRLQRFQDLLKAPGFPHGDLPQQ